MADLEQRLSEVRADKAESRVQVDRGSGEGPEIKSEDPPVDDAASESLVSENP